MSGASVLWNRFAIVVGALLAAGCNPDLYGRLLSQAEQDEPHQIFVPEEMRVGQQVVVMVGGIVPIKRVRWSVSDERVAGITVAPDGSPPPAPFTLSGCPHCCESGACAFLTGRSVGAIEVTARVVYGDDSEASVHGNVRIVAGP